MNFADRQRFDERGAHIRSDNEFAVRLKNGHCDSLNGKLLNGEIFYVIESWRRHYNTVRPHSSLGYRPPLPEALVWLGTKTMA